MTTETNYNLITRETLERHKRYSFAFGGREAKVHLPAPIYGAAGKTRCGRDLSKVYYTEDGVEVATCFRCRDLYDAQDD